MFGLAVLHVGLFFGGEEWQAVRSSLKLYQFCLPLLPALLHMPIIPSCPSKWGEGVGHKKRALTKRGLWLAMRRVVTRYALSFVARKSKSLSFQPVEHEIGTNKIFRRLFKPICPFHENHPPSWEFCGVSGPFQQWILSEPCGYPVPTALRQERDSQKKYEGVGFTILPYLLKGSPLPSSVILVFPYVG